MDLSLLSGQDTTQAVELMERVLLGQAADIGGTSWHGADPVELLTGAFRNESDDTLRRSFDAAVHRLVDDLVERHLRDKQKDRDTDLLIMVVRLVYALHLSTCRGRFVDLLGSESLREAETAQGNIHFLLLDGALKLGARIPETVLDRDLGDFRFGWLAVYGYLDYSLEQGISAFCRWQNKLPKKLDPAQRKDLDLKRKAVQRHITEHFPPAAVATAIGETFTSIPDEARKYLPGLGPDALVAELRHFRATLINEARDEARRNLVDGIGAIREQFMATAAWLFAKQSDKLIPLVAMNAPEPKEVSISKGIVGHVARTGRGYFANRVDRDPLYFEFSKETRSEIAVPIIAVNHQGVESLLGVVNLESKQPDNFVPLHVGELQASVCSLIPDLLLIAESVANPDSFLWHPKIHGWGLSRLLRRFCDVVAQPTCYRQFRHIGVGPTCTVWHLDRDKKRLYVRATSGFDYEYEADKVLSPDSFIGSASRLQRGQVVMTRVKDSQEFVRRRKADLMGLSYMIAAPVFRPKRPHTADEAVGVLSLYFYQEDLARLCVQPSVLYPESAVACLAGILGELVECLQRLQTGVGVARLRSAIADDSFCGTSTFNSIRKILAECMEAEGCSIFGADHNRRLQCLSTSGLAPRQPDEAIEDLSYNLLKESGLTVHVASHPESCLRRNDEDDETEEPPEVRGLESSGKYREILTTPDTGHRRFLGIAASRSRKGNPEVLGVIRLIRAPESKPFVKADEKMLATFAAVCEETFATWRQLLRFHPSPRVVGRRHLRRETEALERLNGPVPPGAIWTRYQLRALLNDLTILFGNSLARAARVYFVPDGGEPRLYAAGTHDLRNESDDPFSDPTTREWTMKALEANKVVTAVTRQAGRTAPQRSIIIPIRIPFKTHPLESIDVPKVRHGEMILPFWSKGLLHLELSVSEKVWDSNSISTIIHTARKLSAITSDNRLVEQMEFDPASPKQALEAFLRLGLTGLGVTAAALHLRSGEAGLRPVAFLGNRKMAESISADTTWLAEGSPFGPAKIDPKNGILQMILSYGPFNIGHLMCRVDAKTYSTDRIFALAVAIQGSLGLWNRLAVSTRSPLWDLEFSAVAPQKPSTGVTFTIWNEAVRWTERELFKEPLFVPLPRSHDASKLFKRGSAPQRDFSISEFIPVDW